MTKAVAAAIKFCDSAFEAVVVYAVNAGVFFFWQFLQSFVHFSLQEECLSEISQESHSHYMLHSPELMDDNIKLAIWAISM